MIQVFTYRIPCEDQTVADQVWEKSRILAEHKSFLLGGVAYWETGLLSLALRISGTDRWKCSRYARQTAKFLLARHGLVKGEPPMPVSVVTEPNLRGLTLEEGRTVRDYPDRATRFRRARESREGLRT